MVVLNRWMSQTKSKLPIPFRPNGLTVLARVIDVVEKSQGGLIEIPNPNYASHQTVRAEIVALGTKLEHPHEHGLTDKDVLPTFHPKVGDLVMIHKNVGNEILLQGVPFKVVRNEDIVGYYE